MDFDSLIFIPIYGPALAKFVNAWVFTRKKCGISPIRRVFSIESSLTDSRIVLGLLKFR